MTEVLAMKGKQIDMTNYLANSRAILLIILIIFIEDAQGGKLNWRQV